MTHILGISCFYHDAAAVLLSAGGLVAAAEEERFTRVKHDNRFPIHAIEFCLRQGGIRPAELEYVAFYEKPLLKFDRILLSSLAGFPRSASLFRESLMSWLTDKIWIRGRIARYLRIPEQRVLFVEHHLSHAASAFLASPFDEAAVVTADAVGEWATTTIGNATARWTDRGTNRIDLLCEMRYPHSLGLLYSVFTAFLGFEVNEGEYKVMGMAPYGEPRYLERVGEVADMAPDGSLHINLDFIAYHVSPTVPFNGRFTKLFGPPRDGRSSFYTRLTHPDISANDPGAQRNQHYADVAASIQRFAEEALLRMARYAHIRTGSKSLCMAGGVALNSVANGRIMRETPFERLYIQPAAGDSGGALGAALHVWHVYLGQRRTFVMEHTYWGEGYDDNEVERHLQAENIRFCRLADDSLADYVATALDCGRVVGWMQGRFEWGPRALGNRSILADPRLVEMKEIVNTKIKFREPFRPFAPAVPTEHASAYFDIGSAAGSYPARFMLTVVPVRKERGNEIPAVNHLGTARIQTIDRAINPRYFDLIACFGQRTGVPVVLNTSFNLRGEPIVSSVEDALSTFCRSGLDTLVVGSCVIEKAGVPT